MELLFPSLSQLNQDTAKVSADVAVLSKEQEEVRLERACLEKAKKDLGAYAEQVRKRSEEVDEMCKVHDDSARLTKL